MKRHLLLATTLLLAGAVSGQTKYFVAPTKYTTPGSGDYYYYYLLSSSYNTYHSQMIYNTATVTVKAASLTGCAFRRMSRYSNECFPMTADVEVWLSTGPNDSATASTTFANNRGKNYVNVLPKVNISVPGAKHTTTPDFVVKFPFKTPFVYAVTTGVKSLVAEFWVSNSKATPPATSTSWYMDGFTKNNGPFAYNGGSQPSTCKYSNGKYPTTGGSIRADIYPGGAFYYSKSGTSALCPGNLTAVCLLGVSGNGMKRNGITLPFSLDFLAPGTKCELRVSPDILIPFKTLAAGGWTWPSVSIPNIPVVIGGIVYEQAIIHDPTTANPLQLIPTMSIKWGPIGTGKVEGGVEVYKSKDTTPPAATGVKRDRMPIIQFAY